MVVCGGVRRPVGAQRALRKDGLRSNHAVRAAPVHGFSTRGGGRDGERGRFVVQTV